MVVDKQELEELVELARNAGAKLILTHDEEALRNEGRTIIESVTVHSGLRGVGPHPMSALAAAERLRELKAQGLLEPVIVSAEITQPPRPKPTGLNDPMPVVRATFADGRTVDLFWFYPDELSFEPEEFVGLNFAAAKQLRFKRDLAFLRDTAAPRAREGRDV